MIGQFEGKWKVHGVQRRPLNSVVRRPFRRRDHVPRISPSDSKPQEGQVFPFSATRRTRDRHPPGLNRAEHRIPIRRYLLGS